MSDAALSVVIPSYYRGRGLEKTLQSLLRSDISALGDVEIIVVDDGSPLPVAPITQKYASSNPTVRLISQPNSGPAAARNRGFTEAQGKIVLFMDDDILPDPNLLQAHWDAHQRNPGAVIHGPCIFAEDNGSAALRRYLNQLSPDTDQAQEFVQITMVASGQISVERKMFDDGNGVYRTDLKTPAAEEFELSSRLRDRKIPILQATRIVAIHDHPVEIRSICAQQYKHAIGCAEAALKCPETRELSELESVVIQNGPITAQDSIGTRCKKILKKCFSPKPLRGLLIAALNPMAEVLPFRLSAGIFHFLVGLYFFAGVREGIAIFSVPPEKVEVACHLAKPKP